MYSIKYYLLIIISFSCIFSCFSKFCTIDKYKIVKCSDEFSNVTNESFIAWASYENNINKTGWFNLEVHTNPNVPDIDQAYYAGYLEGYITYELIGMYWRNIVEYECKIFAEECKKIEIFVQENKDYVLNQLKIHSNNDSYWHQIDLIYKQIHGLQDSVSKMTTDKLKIPDMYLMNLAAELGSLADITNRTKKTMEFGSCSALIKPLEDGSDLLVSHSSWASYTTMLKAVKKYNFSYHLLPEKESKLISGQSVTFSSYPGLVYSLDDYYVLSSGLVVQETTNEIFNKSLYDVVKPQNIVFEFIRNIVANRLAKSGKEWTDIFDLYNSGTYTNQFMIINYNKFKTGTKPSQLPNDLVWLSEQLPGQVRAADVTDIIRKQGYWASYNVAFFKDVYNISGYPQMAEKFGNYFSYNKTARAMIFRRDQHKVTDLKTMLTLMRYDDFKNDPYSRCDNCTPPYSPILTIAARMDLVDPNGVFPIDPNDPYAMDSFKRYPQGATDCKVTNSKLVSQLEMIAVSGPTNDQQPTFQWSTANFTGYPHEGQPDKWDFKPIHVKWLPNKWQFFH